MTQAASGANPGQPTRRSPTAGRADPKLWAAGTLGRGAFMAAPAIEMVDAVARRGAVLKLSEAAVARIDEAHCALLIAMDKGAAIYGVTTGLGAAVDTRLAADDDLQRRIPLARAVGAGRLAATHEVRAMIAARILGISAGRSGASLAVTRTLADMLAHRIHPLVPMSGSLGEGDLAPLAHIALAVVGEGEVEHDGRTMPSREAFLRCGLSLPHLSGKDGLALVSANSACVGTAALLVRDAWQALGALTVATALSFEAYRGNLSPLDPRMASIRPAPGQAEAAAAVLALLADGDLTAPGAARRLQDPLSFRCVASVHGAAMKSLSDARDGVEMELCSSDDNPAVLTDTVEIVANANFDITHLALSIETLGLALARTAACSVERVMKLMSSESSGLPRFLAGPEPGRNGYATLQKTASALLAEIAHKANPMPVVVAPVADRVEDYATMLPAIVEKTREIVEKLRLLTAIEMMVAAQAIELRGGLKLGTGTRAAHALVREKVAPLSVDRPSFRDIEALDLMIVEDRFAASSGQSMGAGDAVVA